MTVQKLRWHWKMDVWRILEVLATTAHFLPPPSPITLLWSRHLDALRVIVTWQRVGGGSVSWDHLRLILATPSKVYEEPAGKIARCFVKSLLLFLPSSANPYPCGASASPVRASCKLCMACAGLPWLPQPPHGLHWPFQSYCDVLPPLFGTPMLLTWDSCLFLLMISELGGYSGNWDYLGLLSQNSLVKLNHSVAAIPVSIALVTQGLPVFNA